MADDTSIEWTDATWNPISGCTKITAGCDNCYASRFAERWRGVPDHPFTNGFDLTLKPDRLDQPIRWKRPRRIFVNSMSDVFHKDVPQAYIDQIFETMEAAPWHVYQVLTKRSSLMRDYLLQRYANAPAPDHIWLGVTVEDAKARSRITHLRQAPASVRFLSIEPLIGPVGELDLSDIHWVIVGGESGPRARIMDPQWALDVRDLCVAQNVPFFFKQWGGFRPKLAGRVLEGRQWSEWPIIRQNSEKPHIKYAS